MYGCTLKELIYDDRKICCLNRDKNSTLRVDILITVTVSLIVLEDFHSLFVQ